MKSFSHAPRIGWLASTLACACPALAQPQEPVTLPEVVVTATRLETRTDAIISDVTVIDAAELQKQSGRTLSEVLTRVAGVQMSANGGAGNTSTVFARGTEGRHVLLLVDGLRVGSATTGTPSFDNLALDSIERIEVLKGPASALYGSDAVGGVVQIITKKGGKAVAPSASATIGSFAHQSADASVSGSQGALRYAIGASNRAEKGFSATNSKAPFGAYNPDRDPYRQTSGFVNLGLDVSPQWTLDTHMSGASGLGHWDNGMGSEDTTTGLKNQILSIGFKGQLSPDWITRLKLGQVDDRLVLKDAYGTYRYRTRNTQWSWTHEVKAPVGVVLAGLDRQNERVGSDTPYDLTSRTVTAGFVGWTGSHERHGWQLNLRRDRNSQFGAATTGFVGYSYRFNPNWRVNASAGTSFKAPSFNDLYDPGFSNPDLQPEKGRSAEIGASYNRGPHELKLTRYQSRIRDLIAFDAAFKPFNAAKAEMNGWTLAYTSEMGNTRIRSTLDVLEARDSQTHLWLPRRGRGQLTLGLDTTLSDWTLGGDLLLMSRRYDDSANQTTLGGFATLDVFASRRLDRNWTVSAKVNNLANKSYELANGYNQAGRAVFITLRYQPQ